MAMGVPVVGSDGLLAGIVTHRDMRFESDPSVTAAALMTLLSPDPAVVWMWKPA